MRGWSPACARAQRLFRDAAARAAERATVLSGRAAVREYVAAGGVPSALFATPAYVSRHGVRELLADTSADQPEVTSVSEQALRRVTREPAPQGVLAVAPIPHALWSRVYGQPTAAPNSSPPQNTLVLVEPRLPGNVGAAMRSAFSLRAFARLVVVGTHAVDPLGPEALRAARGAAADALCGRAEIHRVRSWADALKLLAGTRLVAAVSSHDLLSGHMAECGDRRVDVICHTPAAGHSGASMSAGLPSVGPEPTWQHIALSQESKEQPDLPRTAAPVSLVVGGEAHGLPDDVVASCAAAATIDASRPLNMAAAAAILVAHIGRARVSVFPVVRRDVNFEGHSSDSLQ